MLDGAARCCATSGQKHHSRPPPPPLSFVPLFYRRAVYDEAAADDGVPGGLRCGVRASSRGGRRGRRAPPKTQFQPESAQRLSSRVQIPRGKTTAACPRALGWPTCTRINLAPPTGIARRRDARARRAARGISPNPTQCRYVVGAHIVVYRAPHSSTARWRGHGHSSA